MGFRVGLVNGWRQQETQRQKKGEVGVFLPPGSWQLPRVGCVPLPRATVLSGSPLSESLEVLTAPTVPNPKGLYHPLLPFLDPMQIAPLISPPQTPQLS